MNFNSPISQAQGPEVGADEPLRTRSGYKVVEAIKNFKAVLEQSGAQAAGKSLHHTADLVCSGCFSLWQKLLWEYVFDHVGIASPRIFHFLKKRFFEMDGAYTKLANEHFYRSVEHQKNIAECLLLVRACPRRPPLKMPRVPPETHSGEWVRSSTGTAPPSVAVGRVFRQSHDLAILKRVGDEFAKSCGDGATERALFWMKWLFEEEMYLKKNKEGSLSAMDRVPPGWPAKSRRHVGFYLTAVLAEIYKDLAPKTGMRMHEEFQSLLNLYNFPDKNFTQKRRVDALCLCIQIVCEVPRWKVAAAPSLVTDPLALERAVGHAESFFREVLAFDPPVGNIEKEAKKGTRTVPTAAPLDAKKRKELALQQQLAAYDNMVDSWMGGN